MNATSTTAVGAGYQGVPSCPSPLQGQGKRPETLRSAPATLLTSEQIRRVASKRGLESRLCQERGPEEREDLTAKLLACLRHRGVIVGSATLVVSKKGTVIVADWRRNRIYCVRFTGRDAESCGRKLYERVNVFLNTWARLSNKQRPPGVGSSSDPVAACTAQALQWVAWLLGFSPEKCRASYHEITGLMPAPLPRPPSLG